VCIFAAGHGTRLLMAPTTPPHTYLLPRRRYAHAVEIELNHRLSTEWVFSFGAHLKHEHLVVTLLAL
jgi:hypothetical protein